MNWHVLLVLLVLTAVGSPLHLSGSLTIERKATDAPMAFTPPVIDGVLNDTCWTNRTTITLPLVNWSLDSNHYRKPPHDELNGTLAFANDEKNLYLAVQVVNATTRTHLVLYLDDNVTEYHPQYWQLHRGAVYSRTSTFTYSRAGEIWSVSQTDWWGYFSGRDHYIYDGGADQVFVHWAWTNRTRMTPWEDVAYAMEGAFRFRLASTDPVWLPERVPLIRIHFVLDADLPGEYWGYYVFPPGTPRGDNTEADIAMWHPISTGFPPFTPWSTPTTPTTLLWVYAVGIATAIVTGFLAILVIKHITKRGSSNPRKETLTRTID